MNKNTSKTTKKNGFIKNIKKAIPNNCSNCGNKYNEKDLTLVQKDNFAAVLHLTCSKCKESYLINVVSPLGSLHGSSRMPLKIDISSAKEAKKFIGKKPVSSDDVLNLYDMLSKIDSAKEFEKLLRKNQKSQA